MLLLLSRQPLFHFCYQRHLRSWLPRRFRLLLYSIWGLGTGHGLRELGMGMDAWNKALDCYTGAAFRSIGLELFKVAFFTSFFRWIPLHNLQQRRSKVLMS